MGNDEQTKQNNLEEKVTDLQQECAYQLSRLQHGKKVSVIVGIVLLAVVIIYFGWITAKVKSLVEPQGLAMILRQQIEQRLPEAKQQATALLIKNAPVYADQLEAKTLQVLPAVRIAAQKNIDGLVDTSIEAAQKHAQAVMNQFITKNKKALDEAKRAAQSLEDQQYAEKLLEIYANDYLMVMLDEALNDAVGVDFDTIITMAGASLQSIRDQLAVLQKGKKLTEQQQLQRRLIKLIIKYLQEPKSA